MVITSMGSMTQSIFRRRTHRHPCRRYHEAATNEAWGFEYWIAIAPWPTASASSSTAVTAAAAAITV